MARNTRIGTRGDDTGMGLARRSPLFVPLILVAAFLNIGGGGPSCVTCQSLCVTHQFSFDDGSSHTTTDGDDVIQVLNGPVTINAGAGNDTICVLAPADNIKIYGGPGDDEIHGGEGVSVLWGEAGSDTLVGGGSIDFL
jgi:hypothetical protein